MYLETERLILRPFCDSDGKDLYGYLSREEVVRFEPYPVFSLEEANKEAKKRALDPAFVAVCLRDPEGPGKLIGNLWHAADGAPDWRTWEIGYVFHSDFQGKGYATEAGSRLLEYLFCSLGAERVTAMCDPQNVKSWRLLERLGMRREGHLLHNVFFHRDDEGRPVWKDTYLYAILRSEFHSN